MLTDSWQRVRRYSSICNQRHANSVCKLDSNGGTVAGDDETIVKVAYANAGITAALSIKDGVVGNEWAVALGYAANGLAVNLAVDDGGSEDLSASYDLGGGMSVHAGANEGGAGDRAFHRFKNVILI